MALIIFQIVFVSRLLQKIYKLFIFLKTLLIGTPNLVFASEHNKDFFLHIKSCVTKIPTRCLQYFYFIIERVIWNYLKEGYNIYSSILFLWCFPNSHFLFHEIPFQF